MLVNRLPLFITHKLAPCLRPLSAVSTPTPLLVASASGNDDAACIWGRELQSSSSKVALSVQGAAQQATLDVEAALAPTAARQDITGAAPQTPEAVAAAEAATLAAEVHAVDVPI